MSPADYPRYALSVRQPWAWAIIHGGKRLENRTAGALKHMSKSVTALCIHASQSMSRREYESARAFMLTRGLVDAVPAPADLVRGAVIGEVRVVDRISESTDLWFMGPRALVLADPIAFEEPIPCNGALGFFDWRKSQLTEAQQPKPWMLNFERPTDVRPAARPAHADLFGGCE